MTRLAWMQTTLNGFELSPTHPYVLSTDANAYFFLSPLTPIAHRQQERILSSYFLSAIPMSFTHASAIAQRTSNMITRRTRESIRQNGHQGEVVAWIDNFIVFASDVKHCRHHNENTTKWLGHFDIQCKETDCISLSQKNKEKATLPYQSFLKKTNPTYNDFLSVAGHFLWANATVIRQPLYFASQSPREEQRESYIGLPVVPEENQSYLQRLFIGYRASLMS